MCLPLTYWISSFWFYIRTNKWQVWQMLLLAEQTVQVCLDGSVLLWHAVLKISWSDVCVVNDQMVVELDRQQSSGSSHWNYTTAHLQFCLHSKICSLLGVLTGKSKAFLGCCKTLLVNFSTLLGCSWGFSGLWIWFRVCHSMWIR